MKPEERAGQIIRQALADGIISDYPLARLAISVLIEQAIIDAVEAEREACARIAEEAPVNLPPGYSGEDSRWMTRRNIAEAIRARSSEAA